MAFLLRSPSIVRVTEDITAVPIMVTLRAIAPLRIVDVYALAGAGVYVVHARFDKSELNGSRASGESDDAASLAIHVGGGVSAHVGAGVAVGAEVKYAVARPTLFGATRALHLDTLLVAGTVGYAF